MDYETNTRAAASRMTRIYLYQAGIESPIQTEDRLKVIEGLVAEYCREAAVYDVQ